MIVGLALLGSVIAMILGALPRAGDGRHDIVGPPASIAGTYSVGLPKHDADVRRLGLKGQFELRLADDGTLSVIGPDPSGSRAHRSRSRRRVACS